MDGSIELEPIFMLSPYDEMMQVSPYIVRVTPQIMSWFYQQQTPTSVFFFTSHAPLELICDHFRRCIKVLTPYSRLAFFKMAHSEVAWVMLRNNSVHYWAMIEQAWLPTRVGWKIVSKPEGLSEELCWPLQLTERIWKQLEQVKWMNTLQAVLQHLEKHFPHLLDQDEFDSWINAMAEQSYRSGFAPERDCLFYFNIIGWLGEEAVMTERYPDIYELLTQPSLMTPSQRIEQAAELACQYHTSMSVQSELQS